MKDKFIRFLSGRYGSDQFGGFISVVSLIVMIVGLVFRNVIIYLIALALIVYGIFRMFSRNKMARSRENAFYLKCRKKVAAFFKFDKIKAWFKLQKNKWRDRKTHVYKKCPYCKKMLRLPKVKGRHSVSCPVCSKKFDIKI